MHKILMTTALVIPLSVGFGWAQTATTPADPAAPAGTTTMPAGTTVAPVDGTMPAGTTTLPAGTTVVPVDTPDATAATPAATGTMATDAAAPADAAMPADLMREQAANELRVDWITGTNVVSNDGENVGTVTDVIVDGDTGMMKAVIVGVGGFLGIGEKQIAIDWSKLQVDYDANRITTNITRDEARNAPSYQFREQARAPAAVTGTGGAPAMGTAPAATSGMATTGADPMATTTPAPAATAPAN